MKKIFTIILKVFYFFGFRLKIRRTVKKQESKHCNFTVDDHRKEE